MASNVDCRGIARGECNRCKECSKFTGEKSLIVCAYCSCPPGSHSIVPDSSVIEGKEAVDILNLESSEGIIYNLLEVIPSLFSSLPSYCHWRRSKGPPSPMKNEVHFSFTAI